MKIFCLVDGNPTFDAFEVVIEPTANVFNLKNKIEKSNAPEFDDIPAIKLMLWRVLLLNDDGYSFIRPDDIKDIVQRPLGSTLNAGSNLKFTCIRPGFAFFCECQVEIEWNATVSDLKAKIKEMNFKQIDIDKATLYKASFSRGEGKARYIYNRIPLHSKRRLSTLHLDETTYIFVGNNSGFMWPP
ncbi:hypothetical protein BX616_003412 [Lobosporangium transversale]|nr:hypothetical protein BX616_003412 [Lobosporangium transversale]